jgi:hypothetical protein
LIVNTIRGLVSSTAAIKEEVNFIAFTAAGVPEIT